MKNLAPLTDMAAVPSAYDAEALVSVLVGYLIQAGIPEPSITRMMLDVVDELRRRDADHSYPALRTLAVIGPPGVTEYAAAAADRLAARDAALPWIASIGDVTAGTCYLATNAAGDTRRLLRNQSGSLWILRRNRVNSGSFAECPVVLFREHASPGG